jgi:hypothetical protein
VGVEGDWQIASLNRYAKGYKIQKKIFVMNEFKDGRHGCGPIGNNSYRLVESLQRKNFLLTKESAFMA